ncbi:SDR family oxidoreductase [Deinococcus hohokamensis]|uniref:SDR family oxidoreductase n=1 Tax=Deinococcus hohokamensis TaxID=309883 RepID=A0ABV9I7R4_9DEIO
MTDRPTDPAGATPGAAQHRQRVALVTGATNGIGKWTALELARAGFRVLLTSRDPEKGQRVLDELRAQSGSEALELLVGDLSSMAEVRRVALDLRARHPVLDVLVNNAGGLFHDRRTTVDGFEYTFAFNHLAYFLLTHLLEEPLKAAGAEGEARVVSVSSSGHYLGKLRWDDPEFQSGYAGWTAYFQSKLMNVLFAAALARRLEGTGVTSNTLHPGLVRTGFGQDMTGPMRWLLGAANLFALSPAQGARTSVYLATSPDVRGVTGQYFEQCRPKRPHALALDTAAQDRLWALSEARVRPWLDPR